MPEEQETSEYGGRGAGPYWREQLENSAQVFEGWKKRGEMVVKRYRDEREGVTSVKTSKFNILWSNYQVLFPSYYGRAAKPEVSRRYMDSDPVGRLASTMLERVLEYEVEQFGDYDAAMSGAVQDRLLPGRGTAWIRYCPVITSEQPEEAQVSNTEESPNETIDAAHSPIDYVYWQDFVHSPARIWDEVWWVARWVYMTKDEGIERFGDVFKNVKLTSSNADDDSKQSESAKSNIQKKAKVAEIWNKRTLKVCWISEGYDQALDERPDPLQLEQFFPCPKPLFATTTNGSMIPVPDFCEYQDQAMELDSITQRISMLVKAVKAAGCYNAEYKALGRLLTEGNDNTLIPVENWDSLSEKGGLNGAVEILDITGVVKALNELYQARESVKQIIYEVCGISDILRGATNAGETLGAQQLKANFGSLRIKASQNEVARFASDLFKLKAQIICRFYPPELIVKMSGIIDTPEGRDQQLVQQALALLSDSTARDFSIQVESDSLAQIDEQAEKEAATEAMTAISTFLQSAMPMVEKAPETLPMVSEMLLFLVRRFRAGRGLESSIEQTMKMLQEKASQGSEKPDPETQKAQVVAQTEQARMQADGQIAQIRAQTEMQMHQQKLQADSQMHQVKVQVDGQLAQQKLQHDQLILNMEQSFEKWKVEFESQTKITVAQIQAHAQLQNAQTAGVPTQ